ncbi:MAG: hypothetical protein ACOVO0_11035 [Burkholderiaceae bacterium]
MLHTKIRQERDTLENLERQDFECFLPLIAQKSCAPSGQYWIGVNT